jgi:hypothetical protein
MSPKWALLGLVLLFTIGWVATAAQDCPALVERALEQVEEACAVMRGNQACYGYKALEARLQEGLSQFAFNGVGDITGVDTIETLHLSALVPIKDEWGMTVMRVRADISDEYPNENVTLLAFGAISIDPLHGEEFQPMQAFAIQTGNATSGCNNVTENGLMIQTPEGVGRVTLWINDVRIRVGSTILLQAQPNSDLTVSTLEGLAQVEAQGQMQEASAGMRVRVRLDEAMRPIAPPTVPEAFDAAALLPLVDVVTAFTDGSVRHVLVPTATEVLAETESALENVTFVNLPPPPPSAANPLVPVSNIPPPPPLNGDLPPPDPTPADPTPVDLPPSDPTPGDEGCNGDHGHGNGDGNCHGHDKGM